MQEVMAFYKDFLAKPFDFSVNEEIVIDPKKLNFAAGDAQRKEMWKKKLKFLTLERYTDLLDQREKNKDKKDFVVKTNAELEKEAREKVGKIMDKNFERIRLKFNDDARFNLFINTITAY